MDRPIKNSIDAIRKIEVKAKENDIKKRNDRTRRFGKVYDRGDSVNNARQNPVVPNILKKQNDPMERNQFDIDRQKKQVETEQNKPITNATKKTNETNVLSILEQRKILRQRYTLKLKKDENVAERNQIKNAEIPKESVNERVTQTPEIIPAHTENTKTTRKTDNSYKKPATRLRKPIIKTVLSRAGDVKYKAVTFVDHKPMPSTPLKINLTGGCKKLTSKATDTCSLMSKNTISHVSVPERKVRKKIERKRKPRSDSSPEPKDNEPEVTEVARWAPSCITKQTQPYYEAWVNTTLSAISKDKKFIDDRSFLKRLRKAFVEQNRPKSPDLYYDAYNEEIYTGRIRINQKNSRHI